MDLNLLKQDELASLRQLLTSAENIVICAHRAPDGDAMGSSLAWMNYLNGIGKTNVKVCMPDATPDFLHWLPGSNTVIRYDRRPREVERIFKEADLVCCLDFNQPSRVDAMQDALESSEAPVCSSTTTWTLMKGVRWLSLDQICRVQVRLFSASSVS